MSDSTATQALWQKAHRVVVKIGSALLVNQENGNINQAWLSSFIADVDMLRKAGKQVVVVSSGAVALGRGVLGLSSQPLKLSEKQAAAACGQLALIQGYQKELAVYDLMAAQILLTIEDSENRRRYLNARSTLEALIGRGAVPIINENDTITTSEIRFGDNDRLAARVAQMVGADVLVLLSDVDGLYTANPKLSDTAEHVPVVEDVEAVRSMAEGPISGVGSGGMVTKVMAAHMAVASGCHTILTLGSPLHPLLKLQEGGKHTLFLSHDNPKNARKNWIAHHLNPLGEIVVDDGAAKALQSGKSLLPAGVLSVRGHFERGDCVLIKNVSQQVIGRGLVAYDSSEAERIVGCKTQQVVDILGYEGRDALIHRDDMVLT